MVYYACSNCHGMKAVWDTIFSELHRLPTRCVHSSPILALVGFDPNVRLPLALQVALLGGDPFFAPEQAVATEVLVPLLDKAEPRLIPDQPVV